MKKLYHGSVVSGIKTLNACSSLHGEENAKVVYLSGNLPYSLFYIWDSEHNKTEEKYVTCGLRNGIVVYEEQFENQLWAFYKGVKGYVYSIDWDDCFQTMKNRESMYFCRHDVPVDSVIVIEDVYEEILKSEKAGAVKIIRFDQMPKERLNLFYDHIKEMIIEENLCARPDLPKAQFYAAYFPSVWQAASKQSEISRFSASQKLEKSWKNED